jgi:hypothetical protein
VKQLFFVALLILSSGPAYAEWVAVGTTVDDETIYVDLETIYREGDLVEISVISDFQAAKHLQDGSRYRSARLLHQYNCIEQRFRLVAVTLFAGNLGKGVMLDELAKEGAWRPIPSDSVGRQLMELVCPK